MEMNPYHNKVAVREMELDQHYGHWFQLNWSWWCLEKDIGWNYCQPQRWHFEPCLFCLCRQYRSSYYWTETFIGRRPYQPISGSIRPIGGWAYSYRRGSSTYTVLVLSHWPCVDRNKKKIQNQRGNTREIHTDRQIWCLSRNWSLRTKFWKRNIRGSYRSGWQPKIIRNVSKEEIRRLRRKDKIQSVHGWHYYVYIQHMFFEKHWVFMYCHKLWL